MAISQTTLKLLNTAFRGTPFLDAAVSNINTLLLNTSFRGTPYVSSGAASEPIAAWASQCNKIIKVM